MSEKAKPCDHPGCENDGLPCYLSHLDAIDGADGINGYFCGEHAQQYGFCCCCGTFWGGIESFDFGNGFCEHCQVDLDDDKGDAEDWDNDGDWYEDMP